jgi:hypothetical protein
VTTIAYDLPVKDLIAGLNATGHVTHRSYKKTSVTIHHNGGRLSHEGVLNVWKTRPASAHFDIDGKGAAAQYVKWSEYAWATGNTTGNIESISIEMCNLTTAPKWLVDPVTWKAAARLAGWLFANVIDGKPRPSKSNLHYHHFWKSTDCAGPYMDTVYAQVLAEAQKWYDHFKTGAKPPVVPPKPPVTPPKEIDMTPEQNLQVLTDYNARLYGDKGTEGIWHAQAVARDAALLAAVNSSGEATHAALVNLTASVDKLVAALTPKV